MIAILLFVVACASAAPHYHHHHHQPYFSPSDDFNFDNFVREDMFDTHRFWEQMNREMSSLNAILDDISKRFPTVASSAKVEGNEYVVTVPLSAFEEKDIIVKAKKGLLIVQAVTDQNRHMDIRTLPDCVEPQGSWTFKNGVLRVVFPMTKNEEATTVAPEHSREEMGNSDDDVIDADIDVRDLNGSKTNEIPKRVDIVEATTYAVDVNNDVELVTMAY